MVECIVALDAYSGIIVTFVRYRVPRSSIRDRKVDVGRLGFYPTESPAYVAVLCQSEHANAIEAYAYSFADFGVVPKDDAAERPDCLHSPLLHSRSYLLPSPTTCAALRALPVCHVLSTARSSHLGQHARASSATCDIVRCAKKRQSHARRRDPVQLRFDERSRAA